MIDQKIKFKDPKVAENTLFERETIAEMNAARERLREIGVFKTPEHEKKQVTMPDATKVERENATLLENAAKRELPDDDDLHSTGEMLEEVVDAGLEAEAAGVEPADNARLRDEVETQAAFHGDLDTATTKAVKSVSATSNEKAKKKARVITDSQKEAAADGAAEAQEAGVKIGRPKGGNNEALEAANEFYENRRVASVEGDERAKAEIAIVDSFLLKPEEAIGPAARSRDLSSLNLIRDLTKTYQTWATQVAEGNLQNSKKKAQAHEADPAEQLRILKGRLKKQIGLNAIPRVTGKPIKEKGNINKDYGSPESAREEAKKLTAASEIDGKFLVHMPDVTSKKGKKKYIIRKDTGIEVDSLDKAEVLIDNRLQRKKRVAASLPTDGEFAPKQPKKQKVIAKVEPQPVEKAVAKVAAEVRLDAIDENLLQRAEAEGVFDKLGVTRKQVLDLYKNAESKGDYESIRMMLEDVLDEVDAVEATVERDRFDSEDLDFFDPELLEEGELATLRTELSEGSLRLFPWEGQKNIVMADDARISHFDAGLKSSDRLLDAFSGSSFFSRLARKMGFEGTIIENDLNQLRNGILDEVKHNNEGFATRVQKIADGLDPDWDSAQKKEYLQKAFDEDQLAGTFVAQQVQARSRPINNKDQISPKGDRRGTARLKLLGNIVRSMKDVGEITEVDGWQLIKDANEGDFVVADPPFENGESYQARRTKVTGNAEKITDSLGSAHSKGAKILYFDVDTPEINKALKDLGFEVEAVERSVKGEPWLVAKNFKSDTINENAVLAARKVPDELGVKTKANLTVDYLGSLEEVVKSIGRKLGIHNKALTEALPFFTNLRNIFDLDDVAFGEITSGLKLGQLEVRGAAFADSPVRKLWLNATSDLKNMSEGEKLRVLATTAGHEIGHMVEGLYRKGALSKKDTKRFEKFVEEFDNATPAELKDTLQVAQDALLPKELRDSPLMKEMLEERNLTPSEARANAISLWSMSLAKFQTQAGRTKLQGVNDFIMGLTILPENVRNYFTTLTTWAVDAVNTLRISNLVKPNESDKAAQLRVRSMSEMLTDINKAHRQAQDNVQTMLGIQNVGPENYLGHREYTARLLTDGKLSIGEREMAELATMKHGPENVTDKALRTASHFFERFEQLVKRVPVLGAAGARILAQSDRIRAINNQVIGAMIGADGWNPETGEVRGRFSKGARRYMRVSTNKKLNKAWSAMALENNLLNREGKQLDLGEPHTFGKELKEAWNKLGEGEKRDVQEQWGNLFRANEIANREAVRSMRSKGTGALAAALASNEGADFVKSREHAEAVVQGLEMQKDPTTAFAGQQVLAKVSQDIGNTEIFRNAIELANIQDQAIQKLQAFWGESPGFVAEFRTGKILLKARGPRGLDPEGKPTDALDYNQGFDSKAELDAKIKELKREGYTHFDTEDIKRGEPRLHLNPKLVEIVDDNKKQFNQLIDRMPQLSDTTRSDLKAASDFGAELRKHFAAHAISKPGSRRRFAGGREELDMMHTHRVYTSLRASSDASAETKAWLRYELLNPDLENHPTHVAEIEQQLKNINYPDPELGRSIVGANAVYFLGGNLSSHMLELAQPAFSIMPEMISQGLGRMASLKIIMKAEAAATEHNLKHLGGKLSGAENNSWTNSRYKDLMQEAARRGWIGLGHLTELADVDNSKGIDSRSIAERGIPSKVLGGFGTAAKTYGEMTMKLYGAFTHHTARVALIAGYETASQNLRKANPTWTKQKIHRAAIEEAGMFNKVTTFASGRAGRPVGPFENHSAAGRNIGMGYYSLQSFTSGMLSMAARYAQHGWSKKAYPQLTPTQRKNARKAFGTMLGVQMAAAGALGMPFVGAAIAMLEKHSNLQINTGLRVALSELLGQDEEEGSILTDAILRGAVNAMLGRSPLPADVGSRFAIGGVMGTNDYDGFSTKALFGPTAALVENIGSAAAAVTTEGDWGRALEEAIPQGYKRMVNIARHNNEIRDREGGLMIDATRGEKFAAMIGFNPSRVKEFRDVQRMQRRTRELERNASKREVDQDSDLIELGRPDLARERIQKRAFENPGYVDPQAEARKVAENIVTRRFPRDLRRGATRRSAATEARLLKATGNFGTPPSELDRLRTQTQVMADLGFVTGPTPTELDMAAMVDSLMRNNPAMPRATARLQAQQLLSSQSPFAGSPF